MKIDWKHLATTEGYKSLKAAYVHDVEEAAKQTHPMRKKAVFLKLFNWVISRAKHYSHHTGKPIDEILDGWEKGRKYWWLNYYQSSKQPKFHSGSKKSMGVKGVKKDIKKSGFSSKEYLRKRVQQFIKFSLPKRTKKARWIKERKLRQQRQLSRSL